VAKPAIKHTGKWESSLHRQWAGGATWGRGLESDTRGAIWQFGGGGIFGLKMQ